MNNSFALHLWIIFISLITWGIYWHLRQLRLFSGTTPYKLNQQKGPERVTAFYFKLIPILVFIHFLTYQFFPLTYLEFSELNVLKHPYAQLLGLFIMYCATGLIIISQINMGQAWRIGIDYSDSTQLVQKGIFNYSRNPVFIGFILFLLGYLLALPNAVTLTLFILCTALLQVQVAIEEAHLSHRLGTPYIKYCENVRRWI